jgi:hypothetical protein
VSIASVGVVLIPNQIIRWILPNCFFYCGQDVFFSTKLKWHMSTSVLLPYCISTTTTPPSVSDPMFFLLPYSIASIYWPSVFCYGFETSNLSLLSRMIPRYFTSLFSISSLCVKEFCGEKTQPKKNDFLMFFDFGFC